MMKTVLWMVIAVLTSPAVVVAGDDPAFARGWREPALVSLGTDNYGGPGVNHGRVVFYGGKRVDWCVEGDFEDPERQIEACTRDISNNFHSYEPFDLATRYYNRANAYFDLKRYDKAYSDYSKAIEIKEGIPYFYNNRGLTSYMNGEYVAAIDDYKMRLKADGLANLKTYLNLGDAYFKTGKFADAIRYYSLALKTPPPAFLRSPYASRGPYKRDQRAADLDCRTAFAGAYYKRGLAYRKRGALDKAAADTEKSLEIMRSATSICAEED